ncbi:hypothetical protein [Facilibium subflavum]|uniref:hypothetical protein n=1 Tax=Facilibium subflavum TaxID=2219058 RepID=UPI000E654830|nr:hypothetical protein [Facilibium subflavum]
MLKKITVIFSLLLIGLAGFQFADAKRFGGGFSRGYQRSVPAKTHTNSTANTTPKQNRFGMFGKILAALGIGALLAWLFSSQGMMGLVIVLLLIMVLFWFLRRQKAQLQAPHNQHAPQNHNAFSQTTQNFTAKEDNQAGAQNLDTPAIQDGKLLDGTPEAVFNHQAINLFNQLQTLNNQEGLSKVKSYLTEDLYQSICQDIQDNTDIAEFKELKCDVLACDKHHTQWVLSAQFTGQVKESAQNSWEDFKEIWHFTRQDGEHLWQVAGIQQL